MLAKMEARARRPALAPLAFLALVLAPACGGAANMGAVVRPNDMTAAEAVGEGKCSKVPTTAQPLVVDWPSQISGKLEHQMLAEHRIVLVKYSCDGIVPLYDCEVPGQYRFARYSLKSDVTRLKNSDELRANLPRIAGANVSASLERGNQIEIAWMQVGMLATTANKVYRSDVGNSPECAAATHFVHEAHIGAFVKQTSSLGKVSAAVDVFKMTSSGASESTKSARTAAGSPDACKGEGDKAPPGECRAPIRLELRAILPGDAPVAPTKAATLADDEESDSGDCEDGLVVTDDGTCTTKENARSYVCDEDDVAECAEQCKRGSMMSCRLAGRAYESGKGGAAKDAEKARAFFQQACDGGSAGGCDDLGDLVVKGDRAAALALYEKGCGAGYAPSCQSLANAAEKDGDAKRAVSYWERSCALGNFSGCNSLGYAFSKGKGVEKDPKKATELYESACDGGVATACWNAAFKLAELPAAERPTKRILRRLAQGCDGGEGSACGELGRRLVVGEGIAADFDRGKHLLERGCDTCEAGDACLALARMYADGVSWFPQDERLATAALRKACEHDDGDGCYRYGVALQTGHGTKASPGAAIKAWAKGCKLDDPDACKSLCKADKAQCKN